MFVKLNCSFNEVILYWAFVYLQFPQILQLIYVAGCCSHYLVSDWHGNWHLPVLDVLLFMLDILKFGWGGKRLGITISCLPSQVPLIFGPRNQFLELLLFSFFLPRLSFFYPLRWQQNNFMWRLNMNSVYFIMYHICWIFHNALIFSSYNIHVGVPVLCLAHTRRFVDLLMILGGWSELQECHLCRMAQLDSWSFFIT